MATKFSAFAAVGPSATTEIVGLDGGSNVKFAVGDIDISNLTGLPLSILNGGTGQTTQPLALDAITDATNQVANDVLYIDPAGNVAAFKNPSQLPNVPVRAVLYAEWQPGAGNVNYFNFANGSTINVPFNNAITNFSTDSVIGTPAYGFNWNGAAGAAGNTTFTVPFIGRFKVTVNMHFFDQANGIIVEGKIFNQTQGVSVGLIDDVGNAASGAKTDINYSASGCFGASAGDVLEFTMLFSGGSGSPSPFPSTDNNLITNITVEYIN